MHVYVRACTCVHCVNACALGMCVRVDVYVHLVLVVYIVVYIVV